MARNRTPVTVVTDSGEEEDDDGSSEEVDSQQSDCEPEQTQTATPKKSQPQQPQPPPRPPTSQAPSSSEEEDSGSETESDSDGPDSNVKPLASKPMEEAQKPMNGARKARSKPTAPEPVTPAKPSAAKRASEDTAASMDAKRSAAKRPSEDTVVSKDAKKSKKSADPEASEKKPNLFQRVWSEEDEILVLKGMIEYSSKKECDQISDMDDFYDFIKKSLHMDFSMTQLKDKIRRLKGKYKNNKKKGKERRFAKLHEQSVYELSKEIWGKQNEGEKVVSSSKANGCVGRKKANADVKKTMVGSGEGDRLNLNPSAEEMMLRLGREIYEVEQGLEGEEEWRKLGVEELGLYSKQLELRIAQTKLVLKAIKRGDH